MGENSNLTNLFLKANVDDLRQEFSTFLTKNKKSYKKIDEFAEHMKAYRMSKEFVEATNRQNLDYTVELNDLADLTDKEYNMRLGLKASKFIDIDSLSIAPTSRIHQLSKGNARKTSQTLPASKDWRALGADTDVKDQRNCGSCYAFASVSAIESALIIAGNATNSIDLSEQQLVDCSKDHFNYGCEGGIMDSCFDYLFRHSLMTEDSYPYTGKESGSCLFNSTFGVAKVTSYTTFRVTNPDSLLAYVN